MKKSNQKTRSNKRPSGKRGVERTERNNFQDEFARRQKAKGEREEDYKFKSERKLTQQDAQNDASWYYKDAQILKDVASFSFNKPLGTNLNLTRTYTTNPVSGAFTSVPGVMALEIVPAPGISDDAQSPINLAAQDLYTFVRYKNSGAANYDAPDLMMYLLAMDSLYSAWNWMKRVYGIASTYSQRNFYLPAALYGMEGLDMQNIYANLADFRAYLNMAARRISAFCVPATFTYMVRHAWLFSNLYTDSDTAKAQVYMYMPKWFYTYDETSSPQGGMLKPIFFGNGTYTQKATGVTWTQLTSMLDTMINNLQYSEDIGIMSGDILKAYGEGSLFKVGTFDADYQVSPVYSKEVLTQIENADYLNPIFLTLATDNTFAIVQDPNTNFITYRPMVKSTAGAEEGHHLNFHWDNPTPEDVMVATRLMHAERSGKVGADTYIIVESCGSEIVTDVYVGRFAQQVLSNYLTPAVNNGGQTYYINSVTAPLFINGQATDLPLLTLQILSQITFDWCPMMVLEYKNTTGPVTVLAELRDWDNYVFLDEQDLEALNTVALLSEFNIG